MKQGRLTEEEFAIIRRHPVIGESLCGDLRLLRLVKPIVRHHHERLDGSGYPDGLRGDDVPLLAQIAGRPYRKRRPDEDAYAELRREVQLGWRSAALVDQFIALAQSGRLQKAASPVAVGPTPFGR